MPRTPGEWRAIETATTVQKALNEVLRSAPIVAVARTGVLYTAGTTGKDTDAPTNEEGDPLDPPSFFRAGMRVGSAPIRG